MTAETGPISGHVFDCADGTVGDDLQYAETASQPRGSNVDLLDRAFMATDFHPVADGILILYQDEKAVDQIPNEVLRTEGESQTKDRHATEERPGIDAHRVKGKQGTHDVDGELTDALEYARDRVGALRDSTDAFGVIVLHRLYHSPRNEAHQP